MSFYRHSSKLSGYAYGKPVTETGSESLDNAISRAQKRADRTQKAIVVYGRRPRQGRRKWQYGMEGQVTPDSTRNPSKRKTLKRMSASLKKWMASQKNPSRVKGRKVKGGRAVTLKNMQSVTITRHSNGAVSVRGVQLKGRKR